MLTRRALIAAVGTLATPPALAQDYPAKPVRIIVPYPPGGATDVLARLLAPRIEQELNRSLVIDNRGTPVHLAFEQLRQVAGIDAALMFGIVVPVATPAAIVSRMSEAAAASVRTQPLRRRLEELGYVPIGSTPDEFRARIAADIAKWSGIIEAGNIRPN